jgi:hypothetical protein
MNIHGWNEFEGIKITQLEYSKKKSSYKTDVTSNSFSLSCLLMYFIQIEFTK